MNFSLPSKVLFLSGRLHFLIISWVLLEACQLQKQRNRKQQTVWLFCCKAKETCTVEHTSATRSQLEDKLDYNSASQWDFPLWIPSELIPKIAKLGLCKMWAVHIQSLDRLQHYVAWEKLLWLTVEIETTGRFFVSCAKWKRTAGSTAPWRKPQSPESRYARRRGSFKPSICQIIDRFERAVDVWLNSVDRRIRCVGQARHGVNHGLLFAKMNNQHQDSEYVNTVCLIKRIGQPNHYLKPQLGSRWKASSSPLLEQMYSKIRSSRGQTCEGWEWHLRRRK